MTTLRRALLLLLLLSGIASALPMGAVVGTVESEVPGQVAVYRCQPGPMLGLKPGDVVSVMRAGVTVGEATVVRISPELHISGNGALECLPGDQVVYMRSPRRPAEAPRPAATPSPAVDPSPAPEATTGEPTPAPAPSPMAMGEETPQAPIPEAMPSISDSPPVAVAPPAPASTLTDATDVANLQKWHGDLDTRLRAYLRPRMKGKLASPHLDRLAKAKALADKRRYADASSVYGKLGAALQAEGRACLGSDPVRGRELWSLGLESLSLRALCLFLHEDVKRARAAFEPLARENPGGSLASARALSTVRGRANVYLKRLPRGIDPRSEKGTS